MQLFEQLAAVRNGKEDIPLPLLKLFRTRVGTDREVFELYASAVVADPELFMKCEQEIARDKSDAMALVIEKRIAALVAEFASLLRGEEQEALAKDFPERVVAVIMVAGLAKVEVNRGRLGGGSFSGNL